MNTYRFLGSISLFLAGYATHIMLTADWMLRGKLIVGVLIVILIYIGLAGVLSKDSKEFRDNVVNGLNLLALLP